MALRHAMLLLTKETSLIRTEFFGRRGVLIRGGLLYQWSLYNIQSYQVLFVFEKVFWLIQELVFSIYH